ncbi:odorant receptor 63a-like [Pogonomyrmex barbatus]|uniref:Odorant receptor n=1 Tax=Pogonomyrmex barbatus TaxID=144034 RepID=A0A8N1S5H9_9HYME|nr:odorant receptor 63a-like [Pogonomyrmex barbatus]
MPILAGTVTFTAKFTRLIYHFQKFKSLLQQIRDDWTNVSSVAKQIFTKQAYVEVYIDICSFGDLVRYALLTLINPLLDIMSIKCNETEKIYAPEFLVDQKKYYILLMSMYYAYVVVFISTGAFFYLTAPLTVPILDILMGSDVTRPKRLPHVGVFFLDLEKHYYSILGITYIGYIACCMLVIAVDTIYFALLQHICGVLAILSRRLEKLHDTEDIDHSNAISKRDRDIKNMVQCIQLQIRIERLIQLTESMFAICLFTDIGLGILFQCSASVMIVTHTDTLYLVKNFPLLLIQTARFFFNCWIGQRIIDHSSQVSFAAYNGKWYQMSLEAKKILLFLMMKCRKPYRITMTKLYVICMESYSTLMKTSASYVTLMVSLNSNDM